MKTQKRSVAWLLLLRQHIPNNFCNLSSFAVGAADQSVVVDIQYLCSWLLECCVHKYFCSSWLFDVQGF